MQAVKKSKKFMPHFHIPLQSGSDLILGKMRRRYQTNLYRKIVENISKEIKNVCIGADVIVGFPGETDEEFYKTLNFIKDLPISYLHVFSYSERENTPATNFDHKIPKKTKAERSKQLRILSSKLKNAFYKKYLNSKHSALLEKDNNDGMLYGFTDNYIKIKTPFNKNIRQTKQQVKLLQIDADGIMKAELIN